ncbi:MAG: hypothetical protein GW938_02735 [Leptospira sp.]|nr:hypothetical protein [Leptospira sp.]
MLEEKPTSIGQIIWRSVIGLFLAVLVLMLIVTFLPGDLENNLIDQITGRMSTTAGSVGDRSIQMDYFNSARKDCYYRYQDYAPQLAGNEEMLSNCAYETIRTVYIANELAESYGYQVSDLAIKRELSRQARELYKQSSTQAGYGEEDIRSAEEIYKNILRADPMHFRTEKATALSLFDSFLRAEYYKTSSDQAVQKEAENTKISLRLVSINDSDLTTLVESTLVISDEDAKKEYDKETKAGNTPKDPEGKPLSFEARKNILISKMRLEKKNRAVEDMKSSLKAKREKGASLDELALELKEKPITVSNLSIQDLSAITSNGQTYRLTQDTVFLQDLSGLGFGSNKVGGPYKSNDKLIFVEFTDLKIPESKAVAETVEPKLDESRMLFSFFLEMNQSLGKENPLYRNLRVEAQ